MLKIQFETDNAAFEDYGGSSIESARILRCLANQIEEEGLPSAWWDVFDYNGNVVGRIEVTKGGAE